MELRLYDLSLSDELRLSLSLNEDDPRLRLCDELRLSLSLNEDDPRLRLCDDDLNLSLCDDDRRLSLSDDLRLSLCDDDLSLSQHLSQFRGGGLHQHQWGVYRRDLRCVNRGDLRRELIVNLSLLGVHDRLVTLIRQG